jgi:hypothetical protein
MLNAGHPAAEPANGDFVAYLAQIEKRQLQAIRTAAPTPGAVLDNARDRADDPSTPLNREQASALLETLKQQATQGVKANPRLINAIIPAFVGVIFLLSGLVGDAGIFGIGIGIFLFWIASKQWREAIREGTGKPAASPFGSRRT